MAFVKAALVQDVPPGAGRLVRVGNRTIALFNVGGVFRAVDDACPHRAASLWEGEVVGDEVACPLHGARFSLSSGAVLGPPARSSVACYAVQVVGDEVQIDVP